MRGFWISRVIGRELFLVRIQVFRAGLREAWIGDGAKRGECSGEEPAIMEPGESALEGVRKSTHEYGTRNLQIDELDGIASLLKYLTVENALRYVANCRNVCDACGAF